MHFWSREEGCEPPLNCLWSCCSGSCASVEGRLLKALVHCCITTSYSHHRLYHPLLFDVFLGLCVSKCVSERHCVLYVCGVCLRPGQEKLLCMWQGLKWLRPVKGSSSATDQNTSGQWSQPVKWIDVRQENKWVSDSFPLSDESRANAESLFTERERDGWRGGRNCYCAPCPLSAFFKSTKQRDVVKICKGNRCDAAVLRLSILSLSLFCRRL